MRYSAFGRLVFTRAATRLQPIRRRTSQCSNHTQQRDKLKAIRYRQTNTTCQKSKLKRRSLKGGQLETDTSSHSAHSSTRHTERIVRPGPYDRMLTDMRSGVQVAAAQGSAKNVDFEGSALLRQFGTGGANMGAYSQRPEGKVIAAAFLDAYNQMVQSVRNYAPQSVAGDLGTGGTLAVDGASKSGTDGGYSLADAQRKLAELGLYNSKVDGLPCPGTSHAISTFQKANGLPVTSQLDEATAGALQ